MPHSLPGPSKRPASTAEVEDGPEYQHTHKRARVEGKATAIEYGKSLGSDSISDFRRSVSPWPEIDEVQSQREDLSEALRQRRLCKEVEVAVHRWERQRDLQCEAYKRFRLQRLPSPPYSGVDDSEFPSDSDADEFGYTPLMLGLDNDDPKVEEVFGLKYTRQLERRELRKPNHRRAVQTGTDGPSRIQRPLSSANYPNQDLTLEIANNSSFGTGQLSFRVSKAAARPGRLSSQRITRQSLQRNTVFYELDCRAQARVAKS